MVSVHSLSYSSLYFSAIFIGRFGSPRSVMAGLPFVSLSPARLLNLQNSFVNNINYHPVKFPTTVINEKRTARFKSYIDIFISLVSKLTAMWNFKSIKGVMYSLQILTGSVVLWLMVNALVDSTPDPFKPKLVCTGWWRLMFLWPKCLFSLS